MKKRDNKKSTVIPKSDKDEMQFYIEMASDRTDYKKRIEAIDYFANHKCEESTTMLYHLMIHDLVRDVQEKAFRTLQSFGEGVDLPRKKEGNIIRDIRHKALVTHNSFNGKEYTNDELLQRFKYKYPEAYDVYLYEKGSDNNVLTFLRGIIACLPKDKKK